MTKNMTTRFCAMLVIAIVSGLFFASCSKDDNTTEGTTNKLESEFLKIDNATFVNNTLPEGTAKLISSHTLTKSALNGGSAFLRISANEELKGVNIAVEGVEGYLTYNFAEKKSTRDDKTFNYEVVLKYSQNLKVESFKIKIAPISASGQAGIVLNSEEISVVAAGTGLLQVSLVWDYSHDVDLYVFPPDNYLTSYTDAIYYSYPYVFKPKITKNKYLFALGCYALNKLEGKDTSGWAYEDDNANTREATQFGNNINGKAHRNAEYRKTKATFLKEKGANYLKAILDIDSNPACSIDGVNNENIYFNELQNGTYTVAVNLYGKCSVSQIGATYNVVVTYKGQEIKLSDVQTNKFADNAYGSGASSGIEQNLNNHIIGTFTITDGVAAPTKSAVASVVSYDNLEGYIK